MQQGKISKPKFDHIKDTSQSVVTSMKISDNSTLYCYKNNKNKKYYFFEALLSDNPPIND